MVLFKVKKLPFKGDSRNCHRVGSPGEDFAVQGRRFVIILHLPGGQPVSGNNCGAGSALKLHALRQARPEGCSRLNHAGRSGRESEDRIHDVFRFDLVQRSKLPVAEDLAYRTC
jgi:hypothetical protein